MNAWLTLPLAVRLSIVALAGAWAGTIAHRWAERLRAAELWELSGGSQRNDADSPRGDGIIWIPLLGWWRSYVQAASPAKNRRRGERAGSARLWRLLGVELLTAAAFAGLYWWETVQHGLLIPLLQPQVAQFVQPAVGHQTLLCHLILFWLMLTASLIDLDEKIIPDQITVFGTLLALVLAALLPESALPTVDWLSNGQAIVDSLQLASPQALPPALTGSPHWTAALLAQACFGLWCLALLPRSWKPRRGWRVALALCSREVRRGPYSKHIALMFSLAQPPILAIWTLGGPRWQSLLSALVGMVVGGGIVWLVRVIGQATLKREAMGFGDVTLMAMIGAFLGWQPSLMIFFAAPFFGLAFGIVQANLSRELEIPYGPFLCLGALAVIVRWPVVWEGLRDLFEVPWLIPGTMGVMFVLMTLLLGIWGQIKARWLRSVG